MKLCWEELYQSIEKCESCALHQSCTHKVPGQGDLHAPLMVIGEGPGQQEDQQGLAFVGPAGQLLTRMLSAIGLPRERVYICNVVKCRPPGNRQPTPEEMQACLPYLQGQFLLVRPRVLLLLGATAVSAVMGPEYRITRCHGQWTQRKGIDIIATYHPSALLRDEGKKRPAWEDLQKLRDKLKEKQLYNDLL